MKANLLPSFSATMRWEGGDRLSLDRADPGNWTGGKVGVGVLKGTKWGVSAAAHPELNIGSLSINAAADIFKRDYWDQVGGDALPIGLDHCVSDCAYNSGPPRARALYAQAKGHAATVPSLIADFSEARLSFLHSLRIWTTFGRGWAARVAGVEAESLRMAGAPSGTIQSHADAAQDVSSKHAKIAIGTAAAGSAGAAVAAPHPWIALLVFGVAAAVAIAFLWKSRANAHRAEALQSLASEKKK